MSNNRPIEKNKPIDITPVGNGYLVKQQIDASSYASPESYCVFQSMAELQKWLDDHFDFRSGNDALLPDSSKSQA